jgi:hypothetical protein
MALIGSDVLIDENHLKKQKSGPNNDTVPVIKSWRHNKL